MSQAETVETNVGNGKLEQANNIVKNRVIGSVGVGLIPLPLVDFVALTGIQVEMVRSLSKLYDVPFRKDLVKSIITGLVGGGVPVVVAPTVASWLKAIPLIGQTTGAITMSAFGGASTYAIGKVFIQHFEAGGTLLDFNANAVKTYFVEQYKEGLKVAQNKAN